ARRTQCSNNQRQLGLATHNFHNSYNFLPPAFIGDNSDTPHGWATWAAIILPFIEGGNQYDQWDISRRNIYQPQTAYQTQVKTYLCSSRQAPLLSIGDFATPGGALSDYAASFGTEAQYTSSTGALIPNYPDVAANASGELRVVKWEGSVRPIKVTADLQTLTYLVGRADGQAITGEY
ncbi:MAG: DUF1559 domain-containing protein, partial [Planctomycetota bacterium]